MADHPKSDGPRGPDQSAHLDERRVYLLSQLGIGLGEWEELSYFPMVPS